MVHKQRRVKGASAAVGVHKTGGAAARWRWVALCVAAAGAVLLLTLWAAALWAAAALPGDRKEGFGQRLPGGGHTSLRGGVGAQAAAAAAQAATAAAAEAQAVQPAVAAVAAAAEQLPQPVQVTVTRLDTSIWRVERPSQRSSGRNDASSKPPAPPPPPAAPRLSQQQAAPKVALLLLSAGVVANEAVWRAFFEQAAQLQLQPAVAAAAAAAAQSATPDAASLAAALGPGRTLHPDVGALPPWAYPGYRVQHGLMAGANASSHAPGAAAAGQKAAAAGAKRRGRTPAAAAAYQGSAALTFPAAAQARESGLLQTEMQRLLQLRSSVPSRTAPAATVEGSRGQQGAAWSAYTQRSTLRDALTAAGLPQPAAVLNSSTLMTEHAARPVLVDPARCAASLGQPAHAGGQPPLFSAYVHTPAGQLLPASSLLSGCELRVRLNTTHAYAQHVLAEAEALLLWAALADPLNAKFVLVSDSSIPLYPPQVIWSQLMTERLSRIDACITPGRDTQLSSRWQHPMATPQFGAQHWRKSSQWATLTRQHALLGVSDNHVREMLHRYCYTGNPLPVCVSDEHWLPSLLASYGLDSQSDCEGATHYADWSAGGWHPKTFVSQDLTPRLVQLMRSGIPSAVEALAAQRAAASLPGARQLQGAAQADARAVQPQQQPPLSAAVLAARQQALVATAQAAIAAAAQECNATRAIASASAVLGVGSSRQVQDAAAGSSKAAAAGQQVGSLSLSAALAAAGFEPLGSACPLFARKFPGDAAMANATLAMALSCAGIGLGQWCGGS